jgi:serine protease
MNTRSVFFAAGLFLLLVVCAWAEPTVSLNGGKSASIAKSEPLPVHQIIVKYKQLANLATAAQARTSERMQRLSDAAGTSLGYFRSMSGEGHVLRLPQRMEIDRALEICARLGAMSEVEYAEPDFIMQPFATPNDPQYTNQWHYKAPAAGQYGVNAPAAWDLTTGSASIYAAVIDTGILNHADLSGRWIGGYDFISDTTVANDGGERDSSPLDPGDWVAYGECDTDSPARDSSWHGSHVAGTIGAASNNGAGVAGLNWVSKVVPLRVLGKCGGLTSDIADAMRWSAGLTVTGVPANPYPAKVVNMSLGGSGTCSSTYQDAINAITAAGSVLVVAAGNSDEDASGFQPASCNGVITVAATNRDGGRASYSNYGSVVEVAAPGGETYPTNSDGILSTLNSGATSPASDSYEYYQGTSMAAPHVAGVVSLMFSVNPTLTPTQVMNILQSTVTPFPSGSSCNTSNCGSGIVNAQAAVAQAQGLIGPPTVISTIPASGATGVAVDATIRAVFSKPMNASTINATTFTLSGGITGTVSYSTGTYTATFTPNPPGLAYNTTYTATITTGVTDSGGTHMTATKTWSFTTAGENLLTNGGFEDGLTGWSTAQVYVTGTSGTWTAVSSGSYPTTSPHGGSLMARFNSFSASSGNQTRLYRTAGVSIPSSATAASLRFWMNHDTGYSGDTDQVQVQVSTNGSTWVNVGSPVLRYNGTTGWAQVNIDLTSYKGQSVQVGFLGTSDWGNDIYIDDAELSATVPAMRTLTVNFPGTGSGLVTINPGNVNCNTNYTGQFADGTALTLTGSAYDYSDFSGFTGDCAVNPCSLTMNASKTVNANIAKDTVHKARIGASNYFPTLPAAYGSPLGAVIQAWGTEFAESLDCNLAKDVTLDGGYNDAYSAKSGYSILQVPLTVTSGSLTVDNLIIK